MSRSAAGVTSPRSAVNGWKLLLPIGASALGLCALRLLDPNLINRDALLRFLGPLGPWAPALFVAILGLRPVTLLPGQVFTAVGGMLFGGASGTALALVGSALGSTLTFALGKWVGGRWVRGRLGPEAAELAETARTHDFWFAFLFSLNPLFPTDLVIALAASAGARFNRTLAGTLLAIVPGTLATAYFGQALAAGHPWIIGWTLASWVASSVGGVILAMRMTRQLKSGSLLVRQRVHGFGILHRPDPDVELEGINGSMALGGNTPGRDLNACPVESASEVV